MKTINKLILALIASIAAVSFSGCINHEVNVQESIEITLRPSTILSGFTPYKSSDFDMYSDSKNGVSKLRITCLIYDSTGKLCFSKESLLNNFNEEVTFSVQSVNDGSSYTMVALATCIFGSLSSPSIEAYSIKNTGYIDQLKVEQNVDFSNSYYSAWSVMGYAVREIRDEKSVFVNLDPGIALVYLQYKGIHAVNNIDAYAFGWSCNNIMQFSSYIPKYSQSSEDNLVLSILEPASYPESNNIYEMYNAFPGTVNVMGFTTIGNDVAVVASEKISLDKGHQYVFSLDCVSFKLTAEEAVLGAKSASVNFDSCASSPFGPVRKLNIPQRHF